MAIYSGKDNTKLKFDKTCTFHTLLRFFPHKIKYTKGTCKTDKMTCITIFDRTHLKCDCFDGSIRKGTRHPILSSFSLKVYNKKMNQG